MNDIYNFIRLNNKTINEYVVFIVEINDNISNKKLYSLGNGLFKNLNEKNHIPRDTIVIVSFIKHFSRTIKNMLISETIKNKKEINYNKIIIDYINLNKKKEKLDNYIIYEYNNDYTIHHLKKKFNIKNHLKYYNY